MKPVELRKQTDEQLKLTLSETEKHLFQLRFQSATDRLETPSEINKAKKDIARIRGEMRARELAAEAKLADAQLVEKLALAEKGEQAPEKPFLGRRQAKRVVNRLTRIQEQRSAAAKKPAAKGK